MRRVGVVTVARSDYGYYSPVLRNIQDDPDLELHLIVAGMHLSPAFGMTIKIIEQDGFPINDRVDMLLASDSPESIAKSMSLGIIGFADSYARCKPDILLVLGDRFEMHSAVVASIPFNIPVAHIHGGESTEGLIDEQMRHSITKMSHIHFASTANYARRIIQMGEEPWRVTVSGAPSLDQLKKFTPLNQQQIKEKHGLNVTEAPLLVTYHPVTLEHENTEERMRELLAALEESKRSIVFTYPNADTSGRIIIDMIQDFAQKRVSCQVATNLGTNGYFSLMSHAAAMVGNSSSGIIEAASFQLPVVNIGDRQRGRMHKQNVVDVGNSQEEITAGIKKALSAEFNAALSDLTNPYGDGSAAEAIVSRLRDIPLDKTLIMKRFYDLEVPIPCG